VEVEGAMVVVREEVLLFLFITAAPEEGEPSCKTVVPGRHERRCRRAERKR